MDISQAYVPQQSKSGRRSEFWRGAAAGLPVLLGIIPYALVLGAQASASLKYP
jgi:predicted branched-subunit amino acid permease